MIGAIFWLIVEVVTLLMLWDHFPSHQAWWFRGGFIWAIGLQLFTMWDIQRRAIARTKMLRDILEDAGDAMHDTTRLPGDNSPYPRYMGASGCKLPKRGE